MLCVTYYVTSYASGLSLLLYVLSSFHKLVICVASRLPVNTPWILYYSSVQRRSAVNLCKTKLDVESFSHLSSFSTRLAVTRGGILSK